MATKKSEGRDYQRQKLYDAEVSFCEATDKLATIAECQQFVDDIVKTIWFQNRYKFNTGRLINAGKVTVSKGRQHASASRLLGDIALPGWARIKGTILHELAHMVTPQFRKGKDLSKVNAFHGPQFVRNYIELVKRTMGKDAGNYLAFTLALAGIDGASFPKYNSNLKTDTSPELSTIQTSESYSLFVEKRPSLIHNGVSGYAKTVVSSKTARYERTKVMAANKVLRLGGKMVTVPLPKLKTRLSFWTNKRKFCQHLLANHLAWLTLSATEENYDEVIFWASRVADTTRELQEALGWIDLLTDKEIG